MFTGTGNVLSCRDLRRINETPAINDTFPGENQSALSHINLFDSVCWDRGTRTNGAPYNILPLQGVSLINNACHDIMMTQIEFRIMLAVTALLLSSCGVILIEFRILKGLHFHVLFVFFSTHIRKMILYLVSCSLVFWQVTDSCPDSWEETVAQTPQWFIAENTATALLTCRMFHAVNNVHSAHSSSL